MDQPNRFKPHISGQFHSELESVKNDLLEMGGKVERQIELAADALEQGDSRSAEKVISIDRDINRLEVEIDEQCTRILARRQPAASDLRLIIAIIKLTTDLERIGDESSKVARLSLKMIGRDPGAPAAARMSRIAAHAGNMLRQALDAFARLSVEEAVKVVLSDSELEEDYQLGLREIQAAMKRSPDAIDYYMSRVWALRSLERIGDHASNIAEQVVYLARGVDIRHASDEELNELIS